MINFNVKCRNKEKLMLNILQGRHAIGVLRCPDALKCLPIARDFAASAYTGCVLCVINAWSTLERLKSLQ